MPIKLRPQHPTEKSPRLSHSANYGSGWESKFRASTADVTPMRLSPPAYQRACASMAATDVIRQVAVRAFQQGRRATNMIPGSQRQPRQSHARRTDFSPVRTKHRVLHRHGLAKLEAEMLSLSRDWDRDVDGSPNRLDAAIWALSRLSKIQTNIPIA
jgi:phage terminase large subunit-like protein